MLQLQNLTIKKFDDSRWIVNTPEGRNLLMNERAAGLLTILIDSKHPEEAYEKFLAKFQLNLTNQEFESLVQSTFEHLNILQGEENVYKRPSYLTLKVPLLNSRLAGILARPLKILFRPRIFWPMFSCMLILNCIVAVYLFQGDLINISDINFTQFAVLLGFSMLVHELGHIAACLQFGIRHGAVGFGFYFIFPVVYADITQIWNATKRQRIIANAGGIYSELLYASVLLLFFLITNTPTFLYAAVSIFIKALTELNPFIRYDGYWLVSDIANMPNLMKKSNEALKDFFSLKSLKSYFFNLGHLKWSMPQGNAWLLSYGLANTLLLTAYIIYVVINFHTGIIQFPSLLFELGQKIIVLELRWSDFPAGFLWILGLYFLLFKTAIQFSLRKMKQISFLK